PSAIADPRRPHDRGRPGRRGTGRRPAATAPHHGGAMSKRSHPPMGFTLIELVVTVAIVALLSTLAFPLAEVAVKRSKEQELRLALREIRSALDTYMQAVEEGRIAHSLEHSAYPESLNVLVEG